MELEELFKLRGFKRTDSDGDYAYEGHLCDFSNFETIYYEQEQLINDLIKEVEQLTKENNKLKQPK